MTPRSIPTILTGLALLVTFGGSALAQETVPFSPSASAPVDAALAKANASLPPYVQKRYAFSIVLNTTVGAKDRDDKQPFAGGDVVMMQACPPGYVGANSPMIRDYPMQLVTSMEFQADGRVLPFVKAPTAAQTDYWTLDKDRGYGLDVITLKFRHAAGTDVHLRAKYDGINGSSVYGLVKNTGLVLTSSEKTKYSDFNEGLVSTSKEKMDAALAQIGMLRKPNESAADYAVRVADWTGNSQNLPPVVSGGGSHDIPFALVNHVGGNCNQFSDEQAMMLRSQGVDARIICGANGPHSDGVRIGHVVCEFWDDETRTWYRLPQGTNGKSDLNSCFNGQQENMLIFQVDGTVRYPRTLMRSPGSSNGCGEWMIGENGKYVSNVMWEADGAASWSHPVPVSQ